MRLEVGGQLGPLVGVVVEGQAGPAEEAGHRLGAGAGDQDGEVDRLLHGESADLAVVLDDLPLQEVGEHVVARVPLAVLECPRPM